MSDEKDGLEELREWFRFWGNCVAAVDFESARPLFAERVVGFGTYVEFVRGLDALYSEQWSKVWPKITDFRFNIEHLVGEIYGDAAWAAVPWSSTGYHESGEAFDRRGRATATYVRENGKWLGTHTHFSLKPGTPPHTFGKK